MTDTTTGPFSETLRWYREQAGVSQNRLAAASGINHSTIARYESGSRQPTRDTCQSLCRALALSEEDEAHLMASAGYASEAVRELLAQSFRESRGLARIVAIAQEMEAAS